MPTYEYECPRCGVFEEYHSITAPALKRCPTCGSKLRRLVSKNVNVLYKCSGFYCTDYGTGTHKQSGGKDGKKPSSA